jgi:hypothetical protein
MNTGQTLMTIGAMLFLSVIVLRVNVGFNNTAEVMTASKLRVLAISVATSVLEEATSKSFDNNSDTVSLGTTSQLTAVSSLGLDGSENSSNHRILNDFDDYLCYKTTPFLDSIRIFTNTPKMIFKVFCDVYYIDPAYPQIKSTVRTWHKRIDIRVTSDALVQKYTPTIKYDTIKLSTIYSYWYFR